MNANAFRSHFPALSRRVHLASCSLGARSIDLDEALDRMVHDMADSGNPWERFEEQVSQVRRRFAALIGARVDQVALIPNASIGAYQVASTVDWSDRPRLVSTMLEFPSISHVWLAQRPRGARVVHAERVEDYANLIDRRTRLVSLPLVGYQYAERLPVAELAGIAHEVGAEAFVDAYQAGGTEPVDVGKLGCDYLVMGTLKYLLGLPGLAFLYVREPRRADLDPSLTGWFGRRNPYAFDPKTLDFSDTATKFETGTPAVPACYTGNAGLRLIEELDLSAVREHIQNLVDLAIERLTAQGERIHTLPRHRRGSHIGLYAADPVGLGQWLAERGITVSPRGPVVRLSFHYYNNSDDLAALCAALAQYRTRHGRHSHRIDHESSGRSHVHS